MTEPSPSEDLSVQSQLSPLPEDRGENQEALSELAWSIETSQGEFSLILARCNYANLREHLTQRLRQECAVELSTLVLQESDKTLYTKIRTFIGETQPAALIVFGLESVRDLEQMLASTNQVREEFRKNFHFPLVLWISDQVLMQLVRLASDLESWATTTVFAITADTLLNGLQRKADALFTTILDLGADQVLSNDAIFGSGYHVELQAALQDLQSLGQELEPGLQASLEFALGRDDHANDQIDAALSHYQQSLNVWQQGCSSPQYFLERQGVVLFHIGLCYCRQAEQYPTENRRHLSNARTYFQECLERFEQAQSPVLVAKFINPLGEVLQQLADWEELPRLAEKSLNLQQTYPNPVRLAQAYGFLAAVAINASRWQEAKQNAQKALETLAKAGENRQHYQGLYLLLLAESERNLGQQQTAIEYLNRARDIGVKDNPRLYIQILQALRSLYFEQKQYLEAFRIKLKRLSIEQQYGFRAFVGAGWLQPRRQAKLALTTVESPETVAPEITASDRQQDVERLIERIGRNDCKLIVIHGPSGVGKSSLVNAGLVPALKQKAIGIQDVLPVAMRVYTHWVAELGRLLAKASSEQRIAVGAGSTNSLVGKQTIEINPPSSDSVATILEQLRQNEQHNLRTVLIFDQFEEFFFYVSNPVERQQFFEFLGEALHILPVKVILSLREDYLHYLLEGDRLASMEIISNDILSKNVRYLLRNFSATDAKAIIEELTKRSHFYLEPALVEQLVQDLADESNSVRPIELQVVGAQLQTDNISTLALYQQLGTKEELVKRYLAEVVDDCGAENKQAAELLLYLLTDEKGTRPLKTRADLERDLQELVSADLSREASQLDLVLQVFVESGLVLLLPEKPAARYQLVHDYLAAFIRQQQEPKLKEVMAELEREKEQRKLSDEQRKLSDAKLNRLLQRELVYSRVAVVVLAVLAALAGIFAWRANISEIKTSSTSSKSLFDTNQIFDALIESLKAEKKLKQAVWADRDTQKQVMDVLQQAVVYPIKEHNRLEGHSDVVSSVSFSPDGKTIASASHDNTVKLWQIDGQLLQTLTGHTAKVNSVSFSRDSQTIASASADGTVKLWRTTDGTLLKTLNEDHEVSSVSFSRDSQTIASASADGTVKLWRTDGTPLKTWSAHRGKVNSVSFSPDGQTIASASADGTVKLWRTDGTLLKTLTRHKVEFTSVSFSPDSQTIAYASSDNTVNLWKADGTPTKPLQGHISAVNGVSFSPDGQTIASASSDYTVKLWRTTDSTLIKTLAGHGNAVNSVSFSPDSQTIASASSDNTVKLWRTNYTFLKTLTGHGAPVVSVSFSPDGKTIASASIDNTVKLWRADGTLLRTLKRKGNVMGGISFSPDGKMIASASLDKTVKLWRTDGTFLKTLTGHTNAVSGVSFSPDGKTIASASYDKTVKLWRTDGDGTPIQTLMGHTDPVISVSFSPDGKTIASASLDKTVKLWRTDGTFLKTLTGHTSGVWGVSFSPDSKTIASASADDTVKLWRTDGDGTPIQTLKRHKYPVTSVRFSPNGHIIASASTDKTVNLWKADGTFFKTLRGHRNRVNSISFSPVSKTIASASSDYSVILWDRDELELYKLLNWGCNWVHDYLKTNPNVSNQDRALCDGLGTQK